MKELIKDTLFSLLIVLCIFFVLAIVFYDEISLGKVVPEATTYELTEEMQLELKNDNLEEAGEIIVNYHIDAADLKKYEKNNEYVKGKSNPFAPESVAENNTENSITNNNGNPSTNNNSQQNGFYEDDGTK